MKIKPNISRLRGSCLGHPLERLAEPLYYKHTFAYIFDLLPAYSLRWKLFVFVNTLYIGGTERSVEKQVVIL